MSPTILEPTRFVAGDPLLIAGLQQYYTYAGKGEIPKLWQRLAPYLGNIPGGKKEVTFGLSYQMGQDGFQYLAGVEIAADSQLLEGFSKVLLPAQEYAVFTHEGHVSSLSETCAAIGRWARDSGYEPGVFRAMLERYGEGFNPQTGSGDLEVWYSVHSFKS